ncbi:MAG: NAD(P)-dependent oxidoreductase [Proteobacteria bacterium]|nr:NAD(P)-dependent oxidoreductase [Pseudomonadota bacterium]
MKNVAFFGAGLMGEPIAEHLIDAGYGVTVVCHRNRAPVERLVARGAVEAETAGKAAAQTDVALLVLPTSADVETLVFRPDGIAAGMPEGYLIVDMGTCYPADTRALAARIDTAGGRFIDAPVTGGIEGARAGSLTLMAGGDPAILESIRPIIETFCHEIYHFGGLGAGHAAKLIQNMVGWIEVAGVAEGLALAKAMDFDMDMFFKMLSSSHSNSPIIQWMVPKVLSGAFDDVEFRLDLAFKDIRQAASLGREESKLPLPVVNAATELFQLARASGYGSQDSTAVVRGLETVLGQEIRDPRWRKDSD